MTDDNTRSLLQEQIYALQLDQLRHDEMFHKDIIIMPLAERVKHMALHNAKYVGYFIEAMENEDAARTISVLTDAFVITLATANTLNQDLGLAILRNEETVESLLNFTSSQGPAKGDYISFLYAYAKAAGLLAKACESWDHLEMSSFNTMMRESNLALFEAIVVFASSERIDIAKLYHERLRFIERRSIFHRTFAKG